MPLPAKKLTLLQKLGIALGASLFKLWARSLRFKISETLAAHLQKEPKASVFLLWHNRLAMAVMFVYRKARGWPLTGLVSASGDGEALSAVMKAFGIATARGSSSRRAMEATKELLLAIKDNRGIVITPDGPRGPIYTVKEGLVSIAGMAETYALGLNAQDYWQLKSWDKFILPKPFSTVEVTLAPIKAGAAAEEIKAAIDGVNMLPR